MLKTKGEEHDIIAPPTLAPSLDLHQIDKDDAGTA